MFCNNYFKEIMLGKFISNAMRTVILEPVHVSSKTSNVLQEQKNVPQDVLQGQDNVPQADSQLEKSIDSIILRLINENNKVSREEIARVAGVNVKTIARHLKKLSSKVKYVGSGYSGHWEIIGE